MRRRLAAGIAVLAALVALVALLPPSGERPARPPEAARRGDGTPPPAARPPASTRRERPPARPERGGPPAARKGAQAPPARRAEASPAPERRRAPGTDPMPRAALLIDDLGQSIAHLRALQALDVPLSVAILPGLPATARTAREAHRGGIEVLLHLPMEPKEEERNPGAGALLTAMTPAEIAALVREDLAAVPGAVGVNNHMGSRFTEDGAAMGALMAELRDRRLFWIDSRTTPATVGEAAATAAGIPSASRDVFIDAEPDPAFIRAQLRRLVELARRRGGAIGIGHPYPETLAALAELREELAGSGVAWVPVSALVAARTPAARPLAGLPAPAAPTP